MDSLLDVGRTLAFVDTAHTMAATALYGFTFHMGVLALPFEFELVMYHFMASYSLTFSLYIFTLIQLADYTFSGAFVKSSLAAMSFNIAVLASMSIYRLFFHRCGKFPGPRLASLTRFYATYLAGKDVTFYKEIGKLHEQYGDFVRIGPREISVMRKEAVALVYGAGSECRKSSWYGQIGNNPDKISINGVRDKEKYKLRRRAWDRALSKKTIMTYEPKIKEKVDFFVEKMRESDQKPVDITAWSIFLSFDILGIIGFGKEFNNMSSGKEHPAIQGLHGHVKELSIMGTAPWTVNLMGTIPASLTSFAQFFRLCEEQLVAKEKTWDSAKQPEDIMSWLLKPVKEKDVTASPTRASLSDDCRVVMIAGSDTTSNALTCALYYLAKYPETQRKLQQQIDQAMPEGYKTFSYEKVSSITFLDDIINETLRLKPPAVTFPARETPPQGIRIGDVYIPGNVNVVCNPMLMQNNPRFWQEPGKFIPERWGERRAEMGTDGSPFFPFSLGLHACPGIHLAFLSLRISIAAIVQNFDIIFAPGETGEVFDKECLDTFVIKLPPLRLSFVPRS